jgi:prepilin-type processing-associated H-X9-DG protein
MLSHRCAFCGNQTHFTARAGRTFDLEKRDPRGEVERQMSHKFYRSKISVAATCDACQAYNVSSGLTLWRTSAPTIGNLAGGAELIKEAENMTDAAWSPPSMVKADTQFLPAGVAGFLQEAHDAHSIGAHRAVLLLVRSVIEATAREKGIETGSLVQKINILHADGHVRTGTKDMAHTLRILGNDMAHGEIDTVPSVEDATDALTVVKFVLDDVYVADARRADMMARRGAPPAE